MTDFGIYLISLDKDLQRRKLLETQFPMTYKDFIHISAVDGRELRAIDYFKQTLPFTHYTGRMMSPAELGCSLSHIKALETFLESKNKYGLILEDDILGKDENIQKIVEYANLLPNKTLLVCGGGQEDVPSSKYVFGKPTTMHDSVWQLAKFSIPQLARSCCHLVTKEVAEIFLDTYKKRIVLADDWETLCKGNSIDIYYVAEFSHPALDSSEFLSNIESERAFLPKFKRKQKDPWSFILGTHRKNLRYLMPFTKYIPLKEIIKLSK